MFEGEAAPGQQGESLCGRQQWSDAQLCYALLWYAPVLLYPCRSHFAWLEGNSGLHYAAGYGRKELLEYLLKAPMRQQKPRPLLTPPTSYTSLLWQVGINVNQRNAQGQTPLAVAQLNKQEAGAGV